MGLTQGDIQILTPILVYVQWTRTAKSLGCVLESMGIKFVYYNRMANKKQKARALDEFTNNGEIKILVRSIFNEKALSGLTTRRYPL